MRNCKLFQIIIYLAILSACLGGIFSSILKITNHGYLLHNSPFQLLLSGVSVFVFIIWVTIFFKIQKLHPWIGRFLSHAISLFQNEDFYRLSISFVGSLLLIGLYFSLLNTFLLTTNLFTNLKNIFFPWLPYMLWLSSISLQTLLTISILKRENKTDFETFTEIRKYWPFLYFWGVFFGGVIIGWLTGIITINSLQANAKNVLLYLNATGIYWNNNIYLKSLSILSILFVSGYLVLKEHKAVRVLSGVFTVFNGILIGIPWVFLVWGFWIRYNVGILFFLLVMVYGPLLYTFRSEKWVNIAILIFFIFGIVLILNNVTGLFIPLRSPQIIQPSKDLQEIFTELERKESEPKSEYVQRVNQLIHSEVIHASAQPIPIHENFLLYMYGYSTQEYEFCDYRKAIERGIGLCSQQSIIAATILAENGLETKVLDLDGHTVVSAEIDALKHVWWIVDPDYGVVIDHSIEEIEKDPNIIKGYYQKMGYGDTYLNLLIRIYGKAGNFVSTRILPGEQLCKLEKETYILVWVIPVVLLLPYCFNRISKFLNSQAQIAKNHSH